ncbi:MAG: MBL fold metallo-hydrolase [Clostridia bacterium]|nr:MBL fold metallo-hydrolase [Clostridia bacterium]
MKIKYLGHSSFYVEGKEFSVVTDPFDGIGYDIERVKANFCTISHEHFDHNFAFGIDADKIIRQSEGAFEKIDSFHDDKGGKLRGENFIFCFTIDGVRFCHMGDLGESFNRSLVEKIGKADVLFIPIGGKYTITAKGAKRYIDAINPKTAIAMHFKTRLSTIDIASADEFISLTGARRYGEEIDFENVEELARTIVMASPDQR